MNALAARRRHPAAIAVLLMIGLFLTGAVYAAVAPEPADATTQALPAQSVEEGKALFRANCASCHGLNAEGRPTGEGDQVAGPPLAGFARRAFIAGQFPNTPETLIDFLRDPPKLVPRTGMPDVGLTLDEARHVAAFLATLRDAR